MKLFVACRAVLEPFRRPEALAMLFREPVALGHELRESYGLDVRERSTGPCRESPAEDRAEVRLCSRLEHAFLQAPRRLQRLDVHETLLRLLARRLMVRKRECLGEAGPEELLRAGRVLIEAAAEPTSRTLDVLDHATHDLVSGRPLVLRAEIDRGLLEYFPGEIDRHFVLDGER